MSASWFPEQPREFATTRWSLVIEAGAAGSPQQHAALGALCQLYWYPLYAYVRRQGYTPEDAQDLTQAFFARLLEKQDLATIDRRKGRFRAYLLAALRHFLINEWDRRQAVKRGGGRSTLSLDFEAGERRYTIEPSTSQTPERVFHRAWALATLEEVESRLAAECESQGKGSLFQHVRVHLAGGRTETGYRETAAELGMTEAAVKMAVHRLRRRFRELLREQIGHTVATDMQPDGLPDGQPDGQLEKQLKEQIDDEVRELFAALQGI